ncbi:hypothetical protein Vretimale_6677 [Volvox reticuliferus]|uniref:Uncharacterized protein n=1 Tax=Volvox reticuliferus TaxID=1737510 RepID=A0A8J4LMK4_9CHLO|nr:hypothetical protein Vretimale_6677 [Volvox reticuliferus]
MILSECHTPTPRLHGLQRRHQGLASIFGLTQRTVSHLFCFLLLCNNLTTGLHGDLRVKPPCKFDHVICHPLDGIPTHSSGGEEEDQSRSIVSDFHHDLSQQSRASAFLSHSRNAISRDLTSNSNSLPPAATQAGTNSTVSIPAYNIPPAYGIPISSPGPTAADGSIPAPATPSSNSSDISANNTSTNVNDAVDGTTGNQTTAAPMQPPPPPQQQQLQPHPPLYPHPMHLSCGSYDRLTAPEPGSSCGPDRVVVELDVVIWRRGGDSSGGGNVSTSAAGGGGGNITNDTVNAAIPFGGRKATRMCANPAAYSSETGTLSFALCWLPGDLPDQMLAAAALASSPGGSSSSSSNNNSSSSSNNSSSNNSNSSSNNSNSSSNNSNSSNGFRGDVVLRITLPRLTLYGISSMAPGNYSFTVNGTDDFGAAVHAAAVDVSSTESGSGRDVGAPLTALNVPDAGGAAAAANVVVSPTLSVPVGGAAALTLWFAMRPCVAAATTRDGTRSSDRNTQTTATTTDSSSSSSSSCDRFSNPNGSETTGFNQSGGATGVPWVANSNLIVSRMLSLSLVGPPNPPPASAICKCAAAAAANGSCPAGFVPLVATVASVLTHINLSTANGSNGFNNDTSLALGAGLMYGNNSFGDDGGDNVGIRPYVRCVPQPVYDKVSRRFTFSICWRYACLPSEFARRPYALFVGPILYASVAVPPPPPPGDYHLTASLPDGVNMSYEYMTAVGSPWTTVVPAAGDSAVGGGLVKLPYLGAGQVRIRIRIPFNLDLDNAGGSLDLKLISSTGSGSGSGSRIDTDIAAVAAANVTLVAVSELWLSRRVQADGGTSTGKQGSTVSELAEMVRQGMTTKAAAAGGGSGGDPASVSVAISLLGFRLTLPLQFRDFSAVRDCQDYDALSAFRAAAAAALAASAPTGNTSASVQLISVGCSYGTYAGGRRRRRRRHLQQQAQICTARLNTPVAVDAPALDLDTFLSSSTASLASTYSQSICSLDPKSPEIEVVSKLTVSVAMPASFVVPASAGSDSAGGAASASAAASACTAGAQVLASSLGLSNGQTMVVGCQLSAEAPPDAVPQVGPVSSSRPGGGIRDGGGDVGSGKGRKQSTTIIIAAVSAGTAGVVAVVILAIMLIRLWLQRRRRRHRDSPFLDSEATAGERTFDSISSPSPADTFKELPEDSARLHPVAAPPPPLGAPKRDCRESTPIFPSSSKSLGSYVARPGSSVYGGESVIGGPGDAGGAAGGIAPKICSVSPPFPTAPTTTSTWLTPTPTPTPTRGVPVEGPPGIGMTAVRASEALRTQWRQYSVHSGGSDGGGDGGGSGGGGNNSGGGANTGLRPSWPGQVRRRGTFSWERAGRLACTSGGDDNVGSNYAIGAVGSGEPCGALTDAVPAALGSSMGQCSRPTGGSMVSASGIAAGGWYDLFGLEGAELAGVVVSGRPSNSGRVGGSVGLSARRRRSSGDSTQILGRSPGPDMGGAPLPPSAPGSCARDGDSSGYGNGGGYGDGSGNGSGGGCRGSGSRSRSPLPPSRMSQPGPDTFRDAYTDRVAAAAAASPRSPLSSRTLKPVHLDMSLPGVEGYVLNDEDSPYDGVRLGGGSTVAIGSSSSPGDSFSAGHVHRELLRVQSRRPAFSDRTGGMLAAAAAAAATAMVTSQYDDGGNAAAQSSFPLDISTRIEPRRGGFIHGNSIAPYIVIPPSYTSYIRSPNGAGSSTAGIGGYEAWPPAASGENSPCCSVAEGRPALTGAVGDGGRRGGFNAVGRRSNSYAAATLEPGDFQICTTAQRMQSPPPPPPSTSASASASAWMGGLSWQARSEVPRRSAGIDQRDVSRANARAAAARGGRRSGGGDSPPADGSGATAAAASTDPDPAHAKYKIRRPPRVRTSDADLGAGGDGGGGGSNGGDGSLSRRSRATQGGTGGNEHVAATAAGRQQQTGPQSLQLQQPVFKTSTPSVSRRILPPVQQPSLPPEAAEAIAGPTRGSVSVNRPTGTGNRTAPAAPINVDANRSASPCSHNSTSGGGSADGGDGAATGRRRVEELSPAFGPTPAMRARQMVKRSSSRGSSNGGAQNSIGGLVDPGVEANAETGAARLAMMKRLAVGPPRPAWGLVSAGIGPFKRSIASVQYVRSLNKVDAGSSESLTPPAVAAAAGAATPSAAAARGPRSSVPGRMLLSGSSSAAGDLSATSSLGSGPFLRLIAER